jgi:hypothetical protein
MATQHKYEVWVTEEFDDLFIKFIHEHWPTRGIIDYDYVDSMEA